MHPPGSVGGGVPTGCPNIGDVCTDGTVYAGLSPDGSEKMYTTPADAGQFTWNDGSGNFIDVAMANCADGTPGSASSCRTGQDNTALLVGLSDAASPYEAASYCDGLSGLAGHGHDDWYLPAQDELNVMYDNRSAIGGFNTSGSLPAGFYWSSSENDSGSARLQRFSDGLQSFLDKSYGVSVRCVRKGSGGGSGGCTNPDAPDGKIIYNEDARVLQACAGGQWMAMGPIGGTGEIGPSGCTNIGDLCSDGTYYAGLSPDGNQSMYVAASDESGTYQWGTYGTVTGYTSAADGDGNTEGLVTNYLQAEGGIQAAEACANSTAHSYGDWYLPALDELELLYNSGSPIAGMVTDGRWYWSSTEDWDQWAWGQRFSDGEKTFSSEKTDTDLVRCVRKGAGSGACADPDRPEGKLIYNDDSHVMQYCDGANWVAIGKLAPSGPTGCPNTGDLCSDGSYYIGQIGGNDVYATAAANQISQTWNNGTSNWTTTGFASTTDGPGNTAGLAALSDAGAPYDAAEYCDGLTNVHGHSDWYLPALDELTLFWNGGTPVAGVATTGSWYWSSTEYDDDNAWVVRFSDGNQYQYGDKGVGHRVRCVRQ